MDIQNVLEMLINLVILPAIPILAKFAVDALKAWATEKIANAKNAKVQKYLTEISSVVVQAVMSTTQTYVDSLKAQGKFDLEAQKVAFNTTKETILLLLTTEAKEFIAESYGDIDKWLDTKIEQMVKAHK